MSDAIPCCPCCQQPNGSPHSTSCGNQNPAHPAGHIVDETAMVPNPWLAAGWELDERGKPCKWKDEVHVHQLQMMHMTLEGLLQHHDRVKDAKQRCLAALKLVEDSPDIFVVRVPPEQLIEHDFVRGGVNVITRCRVRWCENAEVAARYAAFEQHTLAEVDREVAHIERIRRIVDGC